MAEWVEVTEYLRKDTQSSPVLHDGRDGSAVVGAGLGQVAGRGLRFAAPKIRKIVEGYILREAFERNPGIPPEFGEAIARTNFHGPADAAFDLAKDEAGSIFIGALRELFPRDPNGAIIGRVYVGSVGDPVRSFVSAVARVFGDRYRVFDPRQVTSGPAGVSWLTLAALSFDP